MTQPKQAIIITALELIVVVLSPLSFAIWPVTFELVPFEGVSGHELTIYRIFTQHNKRILQPLLIFVEFFVVMEGNIQLLEQRERFKQEGNVYFGEVYPGNGNSICFLAVPGHDCTVLAV